MTGPVTRRDRRSTDTRAARRRLLHPGAWWLWATGLAAAAMHTTNPLLLAGIVAVVSYVVAARRQATPWAKSFGSFFKLALFVIAFRVVLQILLGTRYPGTVIFPLPELSLPAWAGGVTIGGPVTVEMILDAIYSSLRLAVVLVCFGAVNALCSPYRLLRSLPAVLYEAGVVVTVALSFAPQAVLALARVREARRLRGRTIRGVRGLRGMAMPVLETALERSVALAASMDTRGYGRRGDQAPGARRLTGIATGVGLLAVCVGVYLLLDASTPRVLALPVLGAGSAALSVVLFSKGRHTMRTRYRADPWLAAEWLTSATGVGVLACFIIGGYLDAASLTSSLQRLELPAVSVLPLFGIGLALLPAWFTPAPPLLMDPARLDAPSSRRSGSSPSVDASPRAGAAA